ncbi:MAG: iron-containing alcohol dehydrogenase [Myxococcaceae bacterium]
MPTSPELFDALGPEIAAEFGGKRSSLPRQLIWAEDAPDQLAAFLAGIAPAAKVVVLADARTRVVAGAPMAAALARRGFAVHELLIPDYPEGASPVCDDLTKDRLARQLPPAGLLVAAGSGVVNDLTKWLAGEAGLPYAVLATAASMNGYAAANVAPSLKGVKSLFRATAPVAIAAMPSVVANAPYELTSSGLGDVIANPVSTADWILNHHLSGEAYSPAVAAVINRLEPRYLDHPEALERRQPEAVRALFEALVYSGCAMTLQGSSLPASGGEHLVSHTLDMLAHVDGVRHDLHGRQVGVGTIFAAALYQRVLALPSPTFTPVEPPFDEALWGPIAGAVRVEWEKKRAKLRDACAQLSQPGKWAEVKRALVPLQRDPSAIKDCLRRAGAAHRFQDLGVSRERFLIAVRQCASIRARFTSIDLAWVTGVLPGAADEIVTPWLE